MTDVPVTKIAIFDSGVGGITVLNEAMIRHPGCHFIYYADSRNIPYGNKHPTKVKQYILRAARFLARLNPDIFVVACNTATSIAIEDLRAQFDFPIVGMEPAVKPAFLTNSEKKILVMATSLTLMESKLSDLISHLGADDSVISLEANQLVTYAENFEFRGSGVREYLLSIFKDLDWSGIGSIVLGCTHFLYFKPIIRKIAPESLQIFDGNEGTCMQIERLVQIQSKTTESQLTCYLSGLEVEAELVQPYINFLQGTAFGYMSLKF